jgi:formylglycine-generating enzyme required for sulfatase activity
MGLKHGHWDCVGVWAVTIVVLVMLSQPAHAVVIFDWATVGNAGNAADPLTGFGAMNKEYRISRYEVTNAQYVEFLNAVDPTGTNMLGLFNSTMAGNFGGIVNTGLTDGARYILKSGRQNNPVTFVSWYDSVRFTNWLHNGQGGGDTETGAYTLTGGTPIPSNGLTITRNVGASHFLPSQDEWYKAAYHDSSAGTLGDYFLYATGSDSLPASDKPINNAAAVNYFGFNGYALTGSFTFPSNTNPMTDVGAYTEAPSPYGTFDQNGNVSEWDEAFYPFEFTRGLRGSSWNFSENDMRSVADFGFNPTSESGSIGFRVASLALAVPEPASALLITAVSMVLLRRRRAK